MATENSVLKDTRTTGFICSMQCSWNRLLNTDCSENGSLCTGSNKQWLEGILFYRWCRKAEDTMKHYLPHRIERFIMPEAFVKQYIEVPCVNFSLYLMRYVNWHWFNTRDFESLVWEIRFIQFLLLINLSVQGYNSF